MAHFASGKDRTLETMGWCDVIITIIIIIDVWLWICFIYKFISEEGTIGISRQDKRRGMPRKISADPGDILSPLRSFCSAPSLIPFQQVGQWADWGGVIAAWSLLRRPVAASEKSGPNLRLYKTGWNPALALSVLCRLPSDQLLSLFHPDVSRNPSAAG